MAIRNFKVNLNSEHLLNAECLSRWTFYLSLWSLHNNRFEKESSSGLKEAVLIRFFRGM